MLSLNGTKRTDVITQMLEVVKQQQLKDGDNFKNGGVTVEEAGNGSMVVTGVCRN